MLWWAVTTFIWSYLHSKVLFLQFLEDLKQLRVALKLPLNDSFKIIGGRLCTVDDVTGACADWTGVLLQDGARQATKKKKKKNTLKG